MIKLAIIFSLKVWLTTAIITPLVLCLLTTVFNVTGYREPIGDYIWFYFALVGFGLAYSFIPFIIVSYSLYILILKQWTGRKTKLILILIAEIVNAALMIGMDIYKRNIDLYTLYLWLPYALVIPLMIQFYKLKPAAYNNDSAITTI